MIITAFKLFSGSTIDGDDSWMVYVITSLLSMVSFVTYRYYKHKEIYIDIFILASVLVMTLFLLAYVCDVSFVETFSYITKSADRASSILILTATVVAYKYMHCREKQKSYFYFAVAVIDFFCMGIVHNVVGQWILVGVFMTYLLLARPTAKNIKRIATLLAVYMFVLSNICLITNYSTIVLTGIQLDIEHSTYLDIIIVICGCIFFRFWDRIPDDVNKEKLIMRRLYKVIKGGVFAYFMVFLLLTMDINHWVSIEDTITGKVIKSFANQLLGCMNSSVSGWYLLATKTNVVTFLLIIFSVFGMFYKAVKNTGYDKNETIMYIIVSGAFIAQMFFYTPEAIASVFYVLALVMAAFYKEKTVHLTTRGIVFDHRYITGGKNEKN